MSQLAKEQIELLTNSILSQAKYFLNDAGEFYPFGSVIDQNDKIKPVSIYFGEEEYPNSAEVLNKLEYAIKEGINKGDYLCAAIGVDVYINIKKKEVEEKKEALEIRLYTANSYDVNRFLYYKKDSEYTFEPIS